MAFTVYTNSDDIWGSYFAGIPFAERFKDPPSKLRNYLVSKMQLAHSVGSTFTVLFVIDQESPWVRQYLAEVFVRFPRDLLDYVDPGMLGCYGTAILPHSGRSHEVNYDLSCVIYHPSLASDSTRESAKSAVRFTPVGTWICPTASLYDNHDARDNGQSQLAFKQSIIILFSSTHEVRKSVDAYLSGTKSVYRKDRLSDNPLWIFTDLLYLFSDWDDIWEATRRDLIARDAQIHSVAKAPLKLTRQLHRDAANVIAMREHLRLHVGVIQKFQKLIALRKGSGEQHEQLVEWAEDFLQDLKHHQETSQVMLRQFENLLSLASGTETASQGRIVARINILVFTLLPLTFVANIFGMTTWTIKSVWYPLWGAVGVLAVVVTVYALSNIFEHRTSIFHPKLKMSKPKSSYNVILKKKSSTAPNLTTRKPPPRNSSQLSVNSNPARPDTLHNGNSTSSRAGQTDNNANTLPPQSRYHGASRKPYQPIVVPNPPPSMQTEPTSLDKLLSERSAGPSHTHSSSGQHQISSDFGNTPRLLVSSHISNKRTSADRVSEELSRANNVNVLSKETDSIATKSNNQIIPKNQDSRSMLKGMASSPAVVAARTGGSASNHISSMAAVSKEFGPHVDKPVTQPSQERRYIPYNSGITQATSSQPLQEERLVKHGWDLGTAHTTNAPVELSTEPVKANDHGLYKIYKPQKEYSIYDETWIDPIQASLQTLPLPLALRPVDAISNSFTDLPISTTANKIEKGNASNVSISTSSTDLTTPEESKVQGESEGNDTDSQVEEAAHVYSAQPHTVFVSPLSSPGEPPDISEVNNLSPSSVYSRRSIDSPIFHRELDQYSNVNILTSSSNTPGPRQKRATFPVQRKPVPVSYRQTSSHSFSSQDPAAPTTMGGFVSAKGPFTSINPKESLSPVSPLDEIPAH